MQPSGWKAEPSALVPLRSDDQVTHVLLVDNHQVVFDALKTPNGLLAFIT